MNKFKSLGRALCKEEQKKIKGGFVDPGGGGACYFVYSSQGYSGCWFTNDKQALCHRVYGDNCSAESDQPVDCASNNCVMN